MRWLQLIKIMFDEPMMIAIMMVTAPGLLCLLLMAVQILTLVFAIRRGNRKGMLWLYAAQAVALAVMFWCFSTDGDWIAIICGTAAFFQLVIVLISASVHIAKRDRFRRKPAASPQWPFTAEIE